MPTDLSTYLALLKLVDDASKDLRLSHLTASDKNVLLALTSFADKDNKAEGFTYIRYCQVVGEDNAVSRSQFFKSIDVLLASNIVIKTGTQRAATFSLCI
jgi:hypothetical protein